MAASQEANTWQQAKRIARWSGYGEKIKVSKRNEPFLPTGFERSSLSIPGTAKAVYRDQRKKDSFQIREYEEYWTIELDQHNPETGSAVKHAIVDAPEYTAIAVSLGAIALGAAGS